MSMHHEMLVAEIYGTGGANLRLTAEQQARTFASFGCCVNEACDRCGEVLAEVRWTRKDRPETYCSQLCRDNGLPKLVNDGKCRYCGLTLPSDRRRGAQYCDRTCRQYAYLARKVA